MKRTNRTWLSSNNVERVSMINNKTKPKAEQ